MKRENITYTATVYGCHISMEYLTKEEADFVYELFFGKKAQMRNLLEQKENILKAIDVAHNGPIKKKEKGFWATMFEETEDLHFTVYYYDKEMMRSSDLKILYKDISDNDLPELTRIAIKADEIEEKEYEKRTKERLAKELTECMREIETINSK